MADVSAECMAEYDDVVSRMFDSEEEGFKFYNKYALEKGFSVRKGYVEWDEANEKIILKKLVCSREGCREEKHMKRKREDRKRKPRNITRVGCKAKFVIARVAKTGRWFVKDFIDEHNHPLAPRDLACFLRSHRRISDEQKADIIEMESVGIRKHKIMDVLCMQYGGYDHVGCMTRDIYNFCHRYKQETVAAGDAQTVIRHMMARQERDPDYFFKYLVDKDGHLKGLFWSDTQSRLDYEAFGDVVVFDSTYRTNKYNLPFVPFVGLNHHRNTVIFGCEIISHETNEAYEWMLRTFSEAMSQKHSISVITDGDLAMQRAVRVVWPDSYHRLCVWHIQQNIVRHLHDDEVREEFRSFIYDSSSTVEHERKWIEFLRRNEVTSEESWLHQMYQMRKLWCAPYLVGRCFLGLSSNQRSESLNSVLHTHLEGKMTLFDMLEHYERCLSGRRLNEAILDIVALQSVPFTDADASSLEKHAARVFTPCMFQLVRWSINAVSKCVISEILDAWELTTYVVAKIDRREKKFEVRCEMNEGSLYMISCSCRKLECLGTPCSHIFYILGIRQVELLPRCCVPMRWTMSAKSAFPPIRKSEMYDYSASLVRYRELRNLSHAACFRACQSSEEYQRLEMVLSEQDGNKESSRGQEECIRFGPVLPQTTEIDCGDLEKVLDPVHV
ncbi:protein FAR1-RELATED SEQUENCE 5-like [Triticum dicoccoides]|uniref:protein FAR1-RELATED SEQUENCE 5-like n=1 Tax=Triticum dicoccoides TaxID=85692 RepID=UPI000E7A4A5C|nr:protein FAR1-RELATED SEQUENCE 5-like [Triticum dicoccoides]XP_037483622.1 protein FAR1-RELATED SEQUENCE 5-like [Triticum dicoccoides]